MVRNPSVCGGSNSGRHWRRDFGERDVWVADYLSCAPCSQRPGPIIERVHCDVRPALRYLGMFQIAPERNSGRSGCLHHRSLLVHRLHILCKPRCNDRESIQRHVRGHQAARCATFHRRAVWWRDRCYNRFPLAIARSRFQSQRNSFSALNPSDNKLPQFRRSPQVAFS